jgi:predicted permease
MLVIVQASLSLVLLTGAGLMMQTLKNLTGQQFGFRMESRAVVNVDAGFGSYSPERLGVIYDEIDRQVRLVPGVRDVALALYSPMSGNNWQMGATLERHPHARISPSWDRVSPSFFGTIGARIVRGRGFDQRDTPNTPRVAVINEEFARQYLANEDPIGQRFGLGGAGHSADYMIVGIVNTIRFRNPRGPGRPMFFLPLLQMTAEDWKDNTKARSNIIQSLILHIDGQAPNLAPHIQRTLAGIDPNLTMLSVIPMSGMLDGLLGHEHLIGTLAQVFGSLALLLASVGLYGITTYSVARRTREIGVRTALGATRAEVVRMILKSALSQAAIGLALGVPASLAAGRVLADQLFGVKNSDPMILGASSIVLVACAALAALLPALRAGSVDPVMALRIEN